MINVSKTLHLEVRVKLNLKSANKVLPLWVDRLGQESQSIAVRREYRMSDPSGELMIQSTPRVTLNGFLDDLSEGNYHLARAEWRESYAESNGTMRLIFALGPRKFKTESSEVETDLKKLFAENLWSAQAFLNPHYVKGGGMNKHADTICVCLNQREPLFRPDGTPVVSWEKDEAGNRLGDTPKALRAEYKLTVMDDELTLVWP